MVGFAGSRVPKDNEVVGVASRHDRIRIWREGHEDNRALMLAKCKCQDGFGGRYVP